MTTAANDDDARLLFLARTHHRPIVIGPEDAPTGSRVGGPPPVPLATAPPRCPRCGGPMLYMLTIAGDLLGERVARGRAVSMLCCRDFDCMWASHHVIEPSSLHLVAHDDAPRGEPGSELDTAFEGRRLLAGPIAEDPLRDGAVYTDAAKIGGGPGYIQGWGPSQGAVAEAGGRVFLLQWSENAFPRDMKCGPVPLMFGVAYLFARVDDATRLPVLEDVCGFWQNT